MPMFTFTQGRSLSQQQDWLKVIKPRRSSPVMTHPAETTSPPARARGGQSAARFEHDFTGVPVHSKAPLSLQTKLSVTAPGDAYEREADSIAERVMRMPEPQGAGKSGCACASKSAGGCGCGDKKADIARAAAEGSHAGRPVEDAAPPLVREALRSPGRPLDANTRAFMEPRFGH